MEWFDFEQIYNGTRERSSLMWVDERVQCKSNTPNNVISESYVPTGAVKMGVGVSTGTMTHVDDFPFMQSKLYSPTHITEIPVVSRAYEESFMVEAGGERPCARGEHCECMRAFAVKDRFIMRAFELPDGTSFDTCVLCTRMETLRLFIDARANAVVPARTVQPYRNIVGVVGEYDIKDCIMMDGQLFYGVLDPFVLYSRAHYRSVLYDGDRRVVQDFADFRDGASPSARES